LMTYKAPVAEQRFLLRHIVKMEELSGSGAYADATPDTVEAILEGIGAFAEGEFAPLNRVGDTAGAKWSPAGVTMPDGFKEAYAAYVESGWGSLAGPIEYGGQGLPLTLATVVLEDLGSANMAFSLVAMLSAGALEALPAHGSPELNAKWLPKIVSGEWPATMNLTEPQAGSDVGALKTRADRQPDGTYRIKGQKIFITYGEHDLAENIIHLVLAAFRCSWCQSSWSARMAPSGRATTCAASPSSIRWAFTPRRLASCPMAMTTIAWATSWARKMAACVPCSR